MQGIRGAPKAASTATHSELRAKKAGGKMRGGLVGQTLQKKSPVHGA